MNKFIIGGLGIATVFTLGLMINDARAASKFDKLDPVLQADIRKVVQTMTKEELEAMVLKRATAQDLLDLMNKGKKITSAQ
jgi:hypothetical protein